MLEEKARKWQSLQSVGSHSLRLHSLSFSFSLSLSHTHMHSYTMALTSLSFLPRPMESIHHCLASVYPFPSAFQPDICPPSLLSPLPSFLPNPLLCSQNANGCLQKRYGDKRKFGYVEAMKEDLPAEHCKHPHSPPRILGLKLKD